MSWESLDQRLDPDSQARVVWGLVCQLDLDAWLKEIKAIERHAGRNATDPRLLVALWVFATLRGVGSARELERLCENHLAYQWLCGGVSVNYHTLADFRSRCGDKWDELLTQIVATLMHEGLVTMDRVAQDGMRVRADSGKSDPYARKPHDTEHTAAWRKRMGEETSRTIYKLRAQTAEWVTALCRDRGLQQMPVRGRTRCRIVATLYAITHNLIQQGNVRAAMAKGMN